MGLIPIPTRKIGKIIRGKATPLQILMAAILGSLIGFVPGFSNGPGLMITLSLLLIILNANLGLALFLGGLAKLVSLACLPMAFAIGRGLLDGPTQPLFKWMINMPVLALFGFDHYATTGGLVLGLVFGLGTGFAVVNVLGRFRRKMATLEEGSERYQKLTSSKTAGVLAWLFIGGKRGKTSYAELSQKKIGNPIRIPGLILAVLVVALLFVGVLFLKEPIVTYVLTSGLERSNGATVDVGNVDLDLSAGKLTVTKLALADRHALDRDLLRAETLEADVSATDLLRKRLKLDRVVVREASSGEMRDIPGIHIGPPPEPSETDDGWGLNPGEKTIEDYIQTAEAWKQRLAQAREWLEKVSGEGVADDAGTGESLRDRLQRQVDLLGYAGVTASHLIDESPTFEVVDFLAEGVRSTQIEGEVLDIKGEFLSTHSHLASGTPKLTVTSRSGRINMSTTMGADHGVESLVSLDVLGLDVDEVTAGLAVDGVRPVQGGTMDLAIDGSWTAEGLGYLDLPLIVTLHDTTFTVGSGSGTAIGKLIVPIGLRGPMDDPRIAVDANQLADALAQAGADELASRLRGEASSVLDDATEKLGDQLGEGVKDALKGLLPGGGSGDKSDG